MATGGTPFKTAAPSRFLNRASGRMESAKQMKAYRAPANRAPAAARALGAPRGNAPRHQPSNGAHASGPAQAVNPLNMSWPQLHRFDMQQVHENTQNELLPYRQRGTELNNIEGNALGKYKGYGEATQGLLKGIQGEGEASAKTAQNEAAARTLAASKAIETTGQTTAQGNAGYLDPQVKAQLAAEQGNVQSTGAAGATGLAAGSASEQRLLESMRGAAAQRTLEGQGSLQSLYGKQRGEVQNKEQQELAKMPGRISAADQAGLQKAFTNRATEQGLGIKLQSIGQKETASRRTSSAAQERTAATRESTGERKWAKEADLSYKETHPSGKSTNAPKAPSPAEARKYMANVSKAEAVAHQQGVTAKTTPKRLAEVRKYLQGLGYNGDQVSAAMNLAYYGVLGPRDRQTAEAYGLSKNMRPNWFRPHK